MKKCGILSASACLCICLIKGVMEMGVEENLERLNIVVLFAVFALGCFVGKVCTSYYNDSGIFFNGAASAVSLIGLFIWGYLKRVFTRNNG